MVDSTTDTETSQQATFINLKKNVLTSLEEDTTEDFCVTLRESGDWNTYRDCRSVTNKILACNVCQFQGTPMFTLRGANWNYYLVQDKDKELGYYFEGYKRDWLEQQGGVWRLFESSGVHLLSLQLYVTGPAGRRDWVQQDRLKENCESSDNISRLTLSTCTFTEDFTCDNGHCIDKVGAGWSMEVSLHCVTVQYKRCNDKLDCEDGSDEENCTVVKLRLDYRRGDPPRLEENVTNLIGEIIDQSYQARAGVTLLHFNYSMHAGGHARFCREYCCLCITYVHIDRLFG